MSDNEKSGEIVTVDFGKKDREAARTYMKLRGLVEKQEGDFLKNPGAFFQDAGKEISRLRGKLRAFRDCIRPPDIRPAETKPTINNLETLVIERHRYERLTKLEAMVFALEDSDT